MSRIEWNGRSLTQYVRAFLPKLLIYLDTSIYIDLYDAAKRARLWNWLHILWESEKKKKRFQHKSFGPVVSVLLILYWCRLGNWINLCKSLVSATSNTNSFWCRIALMFQMSVNKLPLSMWGETIKDWEFSCLDVSVPTTKQSPTRGCYWATGAALL